VLLHVPFEEVNVSPSFAVPLICGRAVFWGVAEERANATEPATPQATIMTASGTSRRRPILCLRMGFSFIGFIRHRSPAEPVLRRGTADAYGVLTDS